MNVCSTNNFEDYVAILSMQFVSIMDGNKLEGDKFIGCLLKEIIQIYDLLKKQIMLTTVVLNR